MLTSDNARSIARELRSIASAMGNLRLLGAIRSQKLVPDLGEWIVSSLLGGEIAHSRTQEGWDVECEGRRFQVRSHAKSEDNPNRWSPVPRHPTQCDMFVIVVFSERLLVEQIIQVPISEALGRARNGRLQWADVQEHRLRPSEFRTFELLRPLFTDGEVV
jgi:hypothetical protein